MVGARPQFVKLAPIDKAFKKAGIEHVIVHTGQHYDPMLSDVFFEDLGISAPAEHLGVGSGSHGKRRMTTPARASARRPRRRLLVSWRMRSRRSTWMGS